jgi:hypothetical protein
MVTRSTEVAGQSSSRQSGTVAGAIGGLALALALAGGVAGWNLAHQRAVDTGTEARSSTAKVQTSEGTVHDALETGALVSDQEMYSRWRAVAARVEADRQAVSDQEMFQHRQAVPAEVALAAPVTDAPVRNEMPVRFLYIVESREQELATQAGLDEANAIRHTMGLIPLSFSTLVVNSPAAEADLAQVITTDYYLYQATGESGLQIVDLRSAVAAPRQDAGYPTE